MEMFILFIVVITILLAAMAAFENKSLTMVICTIIFLVLFTRLSLKYEVLKYKVQQKSIKITQEQVYNSSQKQLDEYIKIDGVYYDYRTKDELSEN